VLNFLLKYNTIMVICFKDTRNVLVTQIKYTLISLIKHVISPYTNLAHKMTLNTVKIMLYYKYYLITTKIHLVQNDLFQKYT